MPLPGLMIYGLGAAFALVGFVGACRRGLGSGRVF